MSSTAVSLIDQDHYAQFGPPHEEFRRLRAEAPVSWHEASDGRKFWAVTKYRDLFKVSLDPKTFSSARRGAIFRNWYEDEYEPQKRLLINLDPPDHTRFRRLVSMGFSSRMIRRLEQHVREHRQRADRQRGRAPGSATSSSPSRPSCRSGSSSS